MVVETFYYISDYTPKLVQVVNFALKYSVSKRETFFSSLDFEKFKWNNIRKEIVGEKQQLMIVISEIGLPVKITVGEESKFIYKIEIDRNYEILCINPN